MSLLPLEKTQIMQPLVTIVVPTIGRPKFLADTIRSILRQTYRHLQILISDNAPPVPSAQLLNLASICDERIEIITRNKRLDFTTHINSCIKQAKGTYVMILSDDDQITDGYIEEMVTIMQAHSDISACVGRQVTIKDSDLGLMPSILSNHPLSIVDGRDFLNMFFSGTVNEQVNTYVSLFTRRSVLLEIGCFPNYPCGAHVDNFVISCLALRGNIAFTANQLFYRIYNTSFGLSMPFNSLLKGTKSYMFDISNLLKNSCEFDKQTRHVLLKSLRMQNYGMLRYRIDNIYAYKLSRIIRLPVLLWYKLGAIRFKYSSD
jgi:glycosyltransferase involved in cell wall biosynthesis